MVKNQDRSHHVQEESQTKMICYSLDGQQSLFFTGEYIDYFCYISQQAKHVTEILEIVTFTVYNFAS